MLACADIRWDIDTASCAAEALRMLADEPADVIVSDMKMPGMDGAQLLTEVRRLYPSTVRIVLSGQASKDSIYRAIPPMHQYLSKPCEAEFLKATITRSRHLGSSGIAKRLHETIGSINSLPSQPSLYQQVVVEVEAANGTAAEVGKLISQDPAMTAKILQLANSAIFDLPAGICCPSQAAELIGMEALKSLVLSLSVFQPFKETGSGEFSIGELSSHSLQVAKLARHISQREGLSKQTAREAFTSGLLHNVGKLILATFMNNKFTAAIKTSKSDCVPLITAEKEKFGICHDAIGGYLLSLWGLPPSITESVSLHPPPNQRAGNELSTPAVVYIANYLSKRAPEPAEQASFEKFISDQHLTNRVAAWSNFPTQ